MVRRVASPGGVEYYNLPIGSPITADILSKARLRNKGKGAPKGASKTSRSGAMTPAPPTPAASPKPAALPKAPAAPKKTAGVRTVSELESTKINKKTTLSGPHKVQVGGSEYSVPDGSRVFDSSPDSKIAYVITPDSEVHVLLPSGEATLKPMETMRLKGLLLDHVDSLHEKDLGAPTPDSAKGAKADASKVDVPTPGAPKAPAPDSQNKKPAPKKDSSASSGVEISPQPEVSPKQKQGQERQAAAMQMLTDSGFLEASDADKAEIRKNLLAASKELRNPTSLGEGVSPLSAKEVEDLRVSMYSGKHVDEHGNFSKERQALHDKIVESFLAGLKPQDSPVQYMNGGGPASGKGTMTRGANAKLTNYPTTRKVDDTDGSFIPFKGDPEALLIDPDAVKMQLPEVQDALAKIKSGNFEMDDKTWAMHAHEESSYISKRLHLAAMERGYHVIYDGTGNGSQDSVMTKVNASRARGYEVHANYIFLEPLEGLKRANFRAERSHRIVPEGQIRGTYKKLPEIFDSVKVGVFDKVTLFDNNVVDGEPSNVIGHGAGDKFQITDQVAYDKFMTSSSRAFGEGGPPESQAIQSDLKKSNKAQGKAA